MMPLPPPIRREKYKADTRLRSAKHRAFVRRHHCVVATCPNLPTECAHVRTGTDGGMGMKPSDQWCFAACQEHHARQHSLGEERFEKRYAIDLKQYALEFALHSPDPAIRQAAKAARVRETEG